jgi:hypothetical protein
MTFFEVIPFDIRLTPPLIAEAARTLSRAEERDK